MEKTQKYHPNFLGHWIDFYRWKFNSIIRTRVKSEQIWANNDIKFSPFLGNIKSIWEQFKSTLADDLSRAAHCSDLQLIWCQYDKWEMQVKINNQHKDICLHSP